MTVTIENTYTGDGSTTDYSFTFPYLDTTDIKVTLATVNTTAYSLLNATTVRFNTAPDDGVAIRIYRETAFATPKATFYPGSAIRANDLNDNTLQNLYVNQESNDKVADAWLRGDQTVISTESWYTNDDTKVASTKAIEGRIDAKIDTALTSDVVGGNKITVTDNSPGSGQITVGVTSGSLVNSDINASAAIAGTKITPNFGSQNIITSGTVDGRDVSADGTKLDGIESAATADQTAAEIRTLVESASDSNVFTDADHSKLNAIEASATADQTAAEIRTLVESASDSNVFTDADHSKLNAIEANATADQTAGEIKTLLQSDKLTANEIATSALNNSHYSPASISADKFNADTVITNSEQSGASVNDTSFFTSSASDARYFNVSTGDTIKDGDTFPDNDTTIATTAAINDRIIDLVDDVGGFVPIANETSFPDANPDPNNGTGTIVSIKALSSNLTSNGSGVATISNGNVSNGQTITINGLAANTTYAATFGMLVETGGTTHTYTFHRLVPKATEVTTVAGSISNVNTVAGSISNVNAVAGNATNINAVAGNNSNITAVAGNASNINSAVSNASNINSAVSNASNINSAVSNASNITTVAGSISNVNTVATNISNVNDFSDKYRVASSAPTSSLDTGDLYFDTSANELRVYNGSSWQGGVTATGNLLSKSGDQMTGNLTFSGSQTVDGRDVSVDGAKLDGIEAGATADQTNAEIRAAVEAASDSNVFTDADHTKLNGIETGATADQTKSDIDALNINAASADTVDVTGTNTASGNSGGWYYPLFTDNYGAGKTVYNDQSGQLAFNPATNVLSASYFSGDGASLTNVNATTLDSIDSGSFLRSDADDTTTGKLTINHNANEKLVLAGTSDPYIRFQEGTSNKAYIQWNASGYLDIKNQEDSSRLLIRDDLSFSPDSSNFYSIWHSGNDGGGSGLDADTLDTLQASSFVRNDLNNSVAARVAFQANNTNDWDDIATSTGSLGGIEIYNSGSGNDAFMAFHSGSDYGIYFGLDADANDLAVGGWSMGTNKYKVLHLGNIDDALASTAIEVGTGLNVGKGTSTASYLHVGAGATGDNYAYIDFVGDTTYTDYGLRLLRSNGGANAGSQLIHRGTGDFIIQNTEAANLVVKTNSSTRLTIGASTGDATFNNQVTCSKLNFQNTALIAAESSNTNIDHIWHDDSANTWNFCSDTTYQGTGNSKVKCGSVEDSKGDLRTIVQTSKSSQHTIVAADSGKHSINSSGGWIINTSTGFTAGQAITLINNSGSDQTITATGVTLYNTADASTGNRTLAQRGMATVLCTASNTYYISGAGLS